MSRSSSPTTSRAIYVPSAVSSFFEICDRNVDGSAIKDALRIGSRGGGFVIKKGSTTKVSTDASFNKDSIIINLHETEGAKTTKRVIDLMRARFGFGPVKVSHKIGPPIGYGFGTSGSGALGHCNCVIRSFQSKPELDSGLRLCAHRRSRKCHWARNGNFSCFRRGRNRFGHRTRELFNRQSRFDSC